MEEQQSLLVEAEEVRYRFANGHLALHGVSFRMRYGESVAVLGPNGSGKTTFVSHLNGLLLPESGEIRVCGVRVSAQTASLVRRKVGFVFQQAEEQLFLPTVEEDIAFSLLCAGWLREKAIAKAQEILTRFGLASLAKRAPAYLSGGEQRKVALLGVLVQQPELLILDEPTANLDPPGVHELTQFLQHTAMPLLLITHDGLFARSLCQRAVFFSAGEIIDEGATERVLERHNWRM